MKKLIFVFGVLCFFSMGAFAQNVGISDNAFTPQSLLHLQDASGGNMLQISSSTAANTGFQVNLSGSDFSLINRENGYLSFYTNNVERMRILNTGYVGFNTTAPTQIVDINGNIRLRSHIFDSNNSAGNDGDILSRDAGGVVWIDGKCSNYGEGFESGFTIWNNSSNDDADWSVHSGSTSSSGTGPTSANEGSYYIYCETSAPRVAGDRFITKVAIRTCETPSITFDYHMYFNSLTDGTLNLGVSTDGGLNWVNIWTMTGDQGNAWHNDETVSLAAYANQFVMLRFEFTIGSLGSAYQYDCALDDINLIDVFGVYSPDEKEDWRILGNAGTNPTTNFLGTTDAQDLAFRTNNSEIVRFKTDGSVGIGTTTTNGMLDIRNNIDKSYGIFLDNNKTTTGTTYGIYLDFDNTYAGNATNFGIYSNLSNVAGNNSAQYGFYDYLYNHGTGNSYGTYINTRKAVNSGNNYGVYAEAANGANAYGVYGAAYGATTNWAGYFAGNAHVSDRLAVANTDPQTSVDIDGDIALRPDATSISITGGVSNDNVNLSSGYSFYRLTATGDATISGFTGGVDGRIVVLHNSSSYELILENRDLSSLTANRIELSEGDVVMGPDEVITLIYSVVEGCWLEMAGTNNTQRLNEKIYTRTNTSALQNFNSTTWTVVPGLQQSITLQRKAKVLIWSSGIVRNNSILMSDASGIWVRIRYNTTVMNETKQCVDAVNSGLYTNVSSNWSINHMIELSPSTYTFYVEVYHYVGAKADICDWPAGGTHAYDYGKLTIMVVEGE